MIRRLKSFIPERVKGPIFAALRPDDVTRFDSLRGRPKVVVALAGFYQNLGDLALTYAQVRLIETVLPDHAVLPVASTDTYRSMKALMRAVGPGDVVTIIGGGNMSDVYESLESARRFVVRSFPDNAIVAFPQSMTFTDTPRGRRAQRRSARTYRRHPRLALFAREPRSLELMRSGLAGTRTELSPDTVLWLRDVVAPKSREGLMLILRGDVEAALSEAEHAMIREVARARSSDVLERDTVDVAWEDCQADTYESTLHDFLTTVASQRVVITDRLHAMIFCVITGTPVVVLSNSNHKMRETFAAWLADHDYVRFIDTADEATLNHALDELWNLDTARIRRPDLSPHFETLRRELLEAAG